MSPEASAGAPAGARVARMEAIREAVLGARGELSPAQRAEALEPGAAAGGALPAPLRALAETVALHAHRLGDEDIEALGRAGFAEDAIFETVVAAAVGAGLARLEAGLAALAEAAGDAA